MRIKPIIDRLKAECPSLTDVRPAISLNSVPVGDPEIPIAFVHSGPEESSVLGENEHRRQQRHEMQVVVLIAAYKYDPVADVDQLEDVREQVRDALLGYTYDEKITSLQSAEGVIHTLSDDLIWWRDVFRCWTFIRGAL